ncbi:hypothetical protein WA1_09140 [Scytonema hofmannii PCC 7110]|uniref:Glutathione S-transferase n=1 Tax=Scytonema hofmannii PCC 7110 TaxID=128403 RepID=A0A139WS86_9CYAN|nr:glutathione S-transferase family protein [Scytonema hofmannii]KYC35304.1 hypothetical protein WA1_09140 [Scytonema hofmannii PCC 7110]
MTSLELYHFPDSLCSQKVRLALAEKGIEWKSHIVNLLTFENLKPDYVRINPKAVVPTLVDDGKVVCNSAIIVRHLDKNFPEHRLTPVEETLTEKMTKWIDLQDAFPMRELIYHNLKGFSGIVARRSMRMKKDLVAKLMRENPNLHTQYAAKLEDVKNWNATVDDRAQVAAINGRMNEILDQLENELRKSDWLCGANYSLADLVWTAVLHYLEQVKLDTLWRNGRRPALAAYIARLKARPSFKEAIQDYLAPKVMEPIVIAGLRRIFLGF